MAHLREQTLTFRSKEDPILISTPLGVIRIFRGSESRKLRFELPLCMTACLTEKEAVEHNEFLYRKNGTIRPKFSLLAPILDANGEMIGVHVPTTFALEERPVEEPQASEEPSIAETQTKETVT